MRVYFQIKHLNLSDQSKLIESIIVTVSFSFSLEDFISGLSQGSITPYYISAIFPGRLCRFADLVSSFYYFILNFKIPFDGPCCSSLNAQSNMVLNSFEIVQSTNGLINKNGLKKLL